MEKLEIKKYEEMLDRVHELVLSYSDCIILSEDVFLFYLGKKYGILDKIAFCNNMGEDLCAEIEERYGIIVMAALLDASETDNEVFEEAECILNEVIFGKKIVRDKQQRKLVLKKAQ